MYKRFRQFLAKRKYRNELNQLKRCLQAEDWHEYCALRDVLWENKYLQDEIIRLITVHVGLPPY